MNGGLKRNAGAAIAGSTSDKVMFSRKDVRIFFWATTLENGNKNFYSTVPYLRHS